jgi:hypothetical protein
VEWEKYRRNRLKISSGERIKLWPEELEPASELALIVVQRRQQLTAPGLFSKSASQSVSVEDFPQFVSGNTSRSKQCSYRTFAE